MSDARTDGTCKQSLQVQVLEIIASEIAYHGTSDEGPTAILAALAEAGLVIVPRAPTEKMVDAGLRASEAQSIRRIYFEMLRAANEQ